MHVMKNVHVFDSKFYTKLELNDEKSVGRYTVDKRGKSKIDVFRKKLLFIIGKD